MTETATIRRAATHDLSEAELHTLRDLLFAAFASEDPDEPFAESDWAHALGATHVIVEDGDEIVAHASVVPRVLEVGGWPLRTGYVEAVATRTGHQRKGYGSLAMREIAKVIVADYELGALGTGVFAFYEALGWERWRGPTSVRTTSGPVRTPEDDGYVMVLRTPATPPLDLDAPISCDWREGDAW
jgi:aminoglycoside 2'-N-acetyltransferase I